MTDIDAIIARAQRGGEFGARRNFTLESNRAFEKMRKFALTNPHLYILELIQGAVANGAQYLDIVLEKNFLRLSYVGSGSGFSVQRLEGLFDALFAKQDAEVDADLRGLAMAFNTLHELFVKSIVVESGDGTEAGSARLEISGGKITIGAPSAPIRGTFVLVQGGARRPDLEEQLILERCISSTIPICLNGRFLFSTRGEKFPMPFGYKRCVRIDEGDLYGTIGHNVLDRPADIKIMVHGVHLWSFPFPEGAREKELGGIVCFNRFRKTVDHADIVRDEVWEEFWARLKPYADFGLQRRGRVDPSQIRVLGDPTPTLLRHAKKRLEGASTIVLVDPNATDFEKGRATIVAETLEGLPVLVEPFLVPVVTSMVKRNVFVIAPYLKDANVMAFFNQSFAKAPADVGAKQTLPALNLLDFERSEKGERYAGHLAGSSVLGELYYSGKVRTRVEGVRVRFVSFGREVWAGVVESVHRGVYLEIALPSVTPTELEREYGARRLAAEMVARWDRQIGEYLEDELSHMLEAGVEPLTNAAHAVLGRIEADYAFGFAVRKERLSPHIRSWTGDGAPFAKMPVFRTLGSENLALRDLPRLMKRSGGLLYLVRCREGSEEFAEFVALEGLERRQILLVDIPTLNTLISLVGEAGIVRVDRRDVLSEAGGITLRDFALGVRDYPDKAVLGKCLLAESRDGTIPSPEQVRPHQEELLKALIEPVEELIASARRGLELLPSFEVSEWLRQASRHLKWAAVHADTLGLRPETVRRLQEMPLFVTENNALASLQVLKDRAEREGFVPVLEGVSQDLVQVALDSRRVPIAESAGEDFILAMNPFVVELLQPTLKLSTAIVHKRLRSQTSIDEGGALVTVNVREANVKGQLGIAPPGVEASIAVTRQGKPTELIPGPPSGLSLYGQLHVAGEVDIDALLTAQRRVLFDRLEKKCSIDRMGISAPSKIEPIVSILLEYLTSHFRWTVHNRAPKLHVVDPDANRILNMEILTLKNGSLTTPGRVLNMLQTAPTIELTLDDAHGREALDWVPLMQDRLWDILVAHGLRFESERPRRSPDYAGQVQDALLTEESAPAAAADLSASNSKAEVEPVKPAAPQPQTGGQAWGARTVEQHVVQWVKKTKAIEGIKRVALTSSDPEEEASKIQVVKAARKLTEAEKRLKSMPLAPWITKEPVVGVEADGTLHPRFVAWVLTYWIDKISVGGRTWQNTTVHFRALEEGPFGGEIELITPDFPDTVRWHEPPGDKTLKLGTNKYRSSSKSWVVRAYAEPGYEWKARVAIVFNMNSRFVIAALNNTTNLARAFPQLLLSAYSALNYRFTSIVAAHESEFQQMVLDRLLENEPFYSEIQLVGQPRSS